MYNSVLRLVVYDKIFVFFFLFFGIIEFLFSAMVGIYHSNMFHVL